MKKLLKTLFLCAFTVMAFAGCTKEGFVADKISVGGVEIGGMSIEDAKVALEGAALDENAAVEITVGDELFTIGAKEAGASFDIEKSIEKAVAESKGVFSGLFKKNVAMSVAVDREMLKEVLKKAERDVIQTSALVSSDGILVTNGRSGRAFSEEIYEKVTAGFASGEGVEAQFVITYPDSFEPKEFLSAFSSEYKEAEYIRGEGGEITVTPEAPGVVFDMATAVSMMKSHTEEGEVFTIPCEVKLSEKTKAELEEKLFRDTLGAYTTNYSSSSANRASNISLATSSIDGIILMPGEEFSFNNSVGKRTVERGYKTAGAYVAGETVDQVGGGICQVSSTLYNAVLLSNLEISSRRSHQMTVSYVPMGRDATVNWGTTDFKFKNNTEYPIKVTGVTKGRNVTISIVGTATVENMEVKILTDTVSVLEPPVETVEDAEKEVGYTNTKAGSKGYVVDATRVVYSNGVEISRESPVRSRYNPKKTVVTVGTKVVEVPTVPYTPPEDYIMPPGIIPLEVPTT